MAQEKINQEMQKWNKGKVEQELIRLVKKHGRILNSSEIQNINSSLYHIMVRYGTSGYWKKRLERYVNYSLKEEIEVAKRVEKLARKLQVNRMPLKKELQAESKELFEVVMKYAVKMGGIRNFAIAHGFRYSIDGIDKKEVMRLYEAGKTVSEIADAVKCTKPRIYDLIKTFEINNKPSAGQIKVTRFLIKKGDKVKFRARLGYESQANPPVIIQGKVIYANKDFFTVEQRVTLGTIRTSFNFVEISNNNITNIKVNGKELVRKVLVENM